MLKTIPSKRPNTRQLLRSSLLHNYAPAKLKLDNNSELTIKRSITKEEAKITRLNSKFITKTTKKIEDNKLDRMITVISDKPIFKPNPKLIKYSTGAKKDYDRETISKKETNIPTLEIDEGNIGMADTEIIEENEVINSLKKYIYDDKVLKVSKKR